VQRLEARQLAVEAQRHQRHVLRHSLSLHRIECAHDRQMRRNVAIREQLIDACPGAGDELERREPPRNARRKLEREQRFDVGRRSDKRVGVKCSSGARCSSATRCCSTNGEVLRTRMDTAATLHSRRGSHS
jgi:hypothetical protein